MAEIWNFTEPSDEDLAPQIGVTARVISLDGSGQKDIERPVAVEVPVEMRIADRPFAVMMVTPSDLVDFAYGFSLTEGLIDDPREIRDVALTRQPNGLSLDIGLVGERLHQHLARQRAMTGRTGCGVCGIDDLSALQRVTSSRTARQSVRRASIARALSELDRRQTLNATTRAVHAAAWADLDGQILDVREDVGRHNALDKLIGHLSRRFVEPGSGFVVITSRCSFEMVEKAARFGAGVVVAISAPTSLAIERAHGLDICLVAIARRDSVTVFTQTERIEVP